MFLFFPALPEPLPVKKVNYWNPLNLTRENDLEKLVRKASPFNFTGSEADEDL